MSPAISVVVPTYRRPTLLRRCLRALRAQTVSADYEVIVVDDASGDETPDVLAEFSDWDPLRAVSQPINRGPAAARNNGLGQVRSALVLFVDDDIVASPTLLERHLTYHAGCDDALGVLGLVEWEPSLERTSFMKWLDTTDYQFGFAELAEGEVPDPLGFVYTCNLSLPTRLLDAAGGFHEEFPYPAHEDTELTMRLLDHGFHLDFRPEALAWHSRQMSLEDFRRRMRQAGESAVTLGMLRPDCRYAATKPLMERSLLHRAALPFVSLFADSVPFTELRRRCYEAAVQAAFRRGTREGFRTLQHSDAVPAAAKD